MSLPARALLATCALLSLPATALAGRGEDPLQNESIWDSVRCNALGQQFAEAAARREVDAAARQQADQGAVLCRAGRFGEGADLLAKAVRMIGETPAK